MKKNRTTKIAIIVLALVLATSCFVGTTLAKYTTKITGTDSARVAKWGVVLTADDTLFEENYVETATGTGIAVNARDGADVIAPGTTGTATIFTISGDPEVDVNVKISLNGDPTSADDNFTMVTIPEGTYTDYTVRTANGEYGTFDVDDDYFPVKWTLTFNGDKVVDRGNLAAVEAHFVTLSHKYEVGENVSDADKTNTSAFDAICGTYVLTWEWDFNSGNDQVDTLLGQMASFNSDADDTNDITIANYVAAELFNLYITVDQVD